MQIVAPGQLRRYAAIDVNIAGNQGAKESVESLILNMLTVGVTSCVLSLILRFLWKRPLSRVAAIIVIVALNTLLMVVMWIAVRGLLLTGDFNHQIILSILLTTLSALIGAWVGAHIALGRFKKERAFDKRLQWYDDVIQVLYKASNTLSVAVHSTRNIVKKNPTYVSNEWGEHHGAQTDLRFLFGAVNSTQQEMV